MQLVAYGAQDIYLTGNPQMTFFKVVYHRHTNFSMESIKQVFNGNADLGGRAVATISRNGDLISRIYIESDGIFDHVGDALGEHIPVLRERYGDSLIKECSIEIGGQEIDKHNALWNRVYSDLTEFNPSGHFGGNLTGGDPKGITGNGTLRQLMSCVGLCTSANNSSNRHLFGHGPAGTIGIINGVIFDDTDSGHILKNKIIIPLNFWFCRNPGLALPLIALQYHEVKLHFEFEHENKLLCSSDDGVYDDGYNTGRIFKYEKHVNHNVNIGLWVDYIYLDTDERRRFAQVSHEYLIEQIQYSKETVNTPNAAIDLYFNHPVKELIWCSKSVGVKGRNNTTGNIAIGTGGRNDPTAGEVSLDKMEGEWTLKLNGHDRFSERDTKYFTRTQVWQHHTGYGALPTISIIKDDFDQAQPRANSSFDTNFNILRGFAADPPNDSYTPSQYAEGVGTDSIAVYSFALEPEEHQPSGTCNFSRIDSAQLIGKNLKIAEMGERTGPHAPSPLSVEDFKMELNIYAINYNVLRIMSGMGGLAYSN